MCPCSEIGDVIDARAKPRHRPLSVVPGLGRQPESSPGTRGERRPGHPEHRGNTQRGAGGAKTQGHHQGGEMDDGGPQAKGLALALRRCKGVQAGHDSGLDGPSPRPMVPAQAAMAQVLSNQG